ncbi:HAD family hydrolase [Paenibacillus alginolyticus]|uniref:HAD-IA family hydrolase n=1 Tax=Paenibacillus alginolyticus TaxID=59839 RepID=A0ABT4GH30_9BACL|nr:HAD-IA family hydrolase [Paenibacillus alginolyticus]MCY9695494.1 HAD-IA family hydrolase [Paenibacillus alginolyticus]MEC0146629.1 HAD-IA family hydrolase [Paenibacillus alginolyticus]
MNKSSQVRGIIFDMDNTLLRSRINFQKMKKQVADFLTENDLLPVDFPIQEHTTSTMIAYVKAKGMREETYTEVMKMVVHYELIGMEGAGLESHVSELLTMLKSRYVLVIVTNNSYKAAVHALEETGIHPYFDLIIGREQMEAMKPSPSGYLAAKQHFPQILEREWISVGDSWIDGRASIDAGIPFISYGTNDHLLKEKGITPIANIDSLLKLLDYV